MDETLHRTFSECLGGIFPLEESIIEEISGIFEYREIEKDVLFAGQWHPNKQIGLVNKGLFRVYFLTEDGKEFIKYFLTEHDVLLANLRHDAENRVSIQALKNSSVFQASYADFLSLCRRIPRLEEMRDMLIDKYWSRKETREMDLLSRDAGENYRLFREEYGHLEKQIPQYYIAGYLGITPTQLSRLRKKT